MTTCSKGARMYFPCASRRMFAVGGMRVRRRRVCFTYVEIAGSRHPPRPAQGNKARGR
jgi:hypothetical protein